MKDDFLRLYVNTQNNNGEKIYIKNIAPTRKALSDALASSLIKIDNNIYSINNIMAEVSYVSAVPFAVGGIIGLIGGFWGTTIGATLGGLYGKHELEEDEKMVKIFNESTL